MSVTGDLQFSSLRNYMKRHESSGSDTMLGPDTSRFFGSYYTRDYVITHDIQDRVPMYRAYYEPFRDGKVFEGFQDTQYYFSNPINTYGGTEDAPTMLAFADETTLTLRLYFTTNAFSATEFNIHWVIYQDYGAEQ